MILIECFYAHSVFKEILCFPSLCILISEFGKSSFSLGYSTFLTFTLIINELWTRKYWIYYFLALKVEKLRGSMLIDYDHAMANWDTYKFCLQSQVRHSEIDVTHDVLFFECNSIMKFISPYQRIVWNMATFCKRITERPVANQIL